MKLRTLDIKQQQDEGQIETTNGRGLTYSLPSQWERTLTVTMDILLESTDDELTLQSDEAPEDTLQRIVDRLKRPAGDSGSGRGIVVTLKPGLDGAARYSMIVQPGQVVNMPISMIAISPTGEMIQLAVDFDITAREAGL